MELRVEVSAAIDQACADGARLRRACAADAVRTPANRLSPKEQAEILTMANRAEFAHLSPHQIVPALADEGRDLASESTFYRLLRNADQLARRGRPKAPARVRPQPFEATGPNQVWSWDITYLASTVRGAFFYLSLIMDVYSRKMVGWEVYPEESAEHAASVFHKAHLREGVRADAPVLHSDNGAPMEGATMLATLQRLGVVPSFSRPSVSNDNPYSESLFNAVKGRPDFPDKPFDTPDAARAWVANFACWYNDEHLHSALKFVPPAQRHRREDTDLLSKREALYQAARAANPARWSGSTRDWNAPSSVLLNPRKPPARKGQSDANDA